MKEIEFTGEQMVYFARYCLQNDHLITKAYYAKDELSLQTLHSALMDWEKINGAVRKGMEVTLGNLIDQLSIENIRIWFAEDIKRKEGATDNEIANATKITNIANMKRNALIQAIDEALGQQSFNQGSNKMYGK